MAIDAQIAVIARLLNHVSGTFGGVVGVYQHYDFMPEMRDAVGRWERHPRAISRAGSSKALVTSAEQRPVFGLLFRTSESRVASMILCELVPVLIFVAEHGEGI